MSKINYTRRELLSGLFTHTPYAVAISFFKLLGYDDYMNNNHIDPYDLSFASTERITVYKHTDPEFKNLNPYHLDSNLSNQIDMNDIILYHAKGVLIDNFFHSDFEVGKETIVKVVTLRNFEADQFLVWTYISQYQYNDNWTDGNFIEANISIHIFNECPNNGNCEICDTNNFTLLHTHCPVYYFHEDKPSAPIYNLLFD